MNRNAFFFYFQIDLKEVEHLIGKEGGPFLIDDMRVNTNSWSLSILKKKGFRCTACGLEGKVCWIQKQKKGVLVPTLVVYGVKGKEQIPLTVDHIVAKADGGSSGLHNLQCLCLVCNGLKASKASGKKLPCCGGNYGTLPRNGSVHMKGFMHSKDCEHGHFLRHRWNDISRWMVG